MFPSPNWESIVYGTDEPICRVGIETGTEKMACGHAEGMGRVGRTERVALTYLKQIASGKL